MPRAEHNARVLFFKRKRLDRFDPDDWLGDLKPFLSFSRKNSASSRRHHHPALTEAASRLQPPALTEAASPSPRDPVTLGRLRSPSPGDALTSGDALTHRGCL